jgi:hypothetical protein
MYNVIPGSSKNILLLNFTAKYILSLLFSNIHVIPAYRDKDFALSRSLSYRNFFEDQE